MIMNQDFTTSFAVVPGLGGGRGGGSPQHLGRLIAEYFQQNRSEQWMRNAASETNRSEFMGDVRQARKIAIQARKTIREDLETAFEPIKRAVETLYRHEMADSDQVVPLKRKNARRGNDVSVGGGGVAPSGDGDGDQQLKESARNVGDEKKNSSSSTSNKQDKNLIPVLKSLPGRRAVERISYNAGKLTRVIQTQLLDKIDQLGRILRRMPLSSSGSESAAGAPSASGGTSSILAGRSLKLLDPAMLPFFDQVAAKPTADGGNVGIDGASASSGEKSILGMPCQSRCRPMQGTDFAWCVVRPPSGTQKRLLETDPTLADHNLYKDLRNTPGGDGIIEGGGGALDDAQVGEGDEPPSTAAILIKSPGRYWDYCVQRMSDLREPSVDPGAGVPVHLAESDASVDGQFRSPCRCVAEAEKLRTRYRQQLPKFARNLMAEQEDASALPQTTRERREAEKKRAEQGGSGEGDRETFLDLRKVPIRDRFALQIVESRKQRRLSGARVPGGVLQPKDEIDGLRVLSEGGRGEKISNLCPRVPVVSSPGIGDEKGGDSGSSDPVRPSWPICVVDESCKGLRGSWFEGHSWDFCLSSEVGKPTISAL
ncbi:unnamed protein product [Amoebophrya sp. A25]|nr:unnamed protein product [Amoebophrya sp. A25]|eukprot:GSA25T00007425001.1